MRLPRGAERDPSAHHRLSGSRNLTIAQCHCDVLRDTAGRALDDLVEGELVMATGETQRVGPLGDLVHFVGAASRVALLIPTRTNPLRRALPMTPRRQLCIDVDLGGRTASHPVAANPYQTTARLVKRQLIGGRTPTRGS